MGAFDDLIPASQSANPGAFDDLIPAKPSGGLAAAAKQAIGAGIKGAGRAAADFIPGVTPANPISQYGQEVIDANPTAVQSFSDIADSPWTAVKEAVGNAGGSMAGMLGARALGTGITMAAPFTGPAAPLVGLAGQAIANVGPFVAAALPSYGGIRDEQIKADPANEADARSKAIAALGAGTVGAIETKFGPQDWALSAMKKGGIEAVAKKFADAKSIPGAIGKGIVRGGAIEGAEELVQNPIEQLASYQDPTSRQAVGETLFGGAMGALGGGALGGGMAGVAKAMTPEQPVVTLPGASPTVAPPSASPTVAPPSAAPTTAVPTNVAPQPTTVSAPIEINPAAGPLQAATVAGIQSGAVQPAVTTNQVTNETTQIHAGAPAPVAQAASQEKAPVQNPSSPAYSGLLGDDGAPEVGAATFDRSTTPKNGGYGATENSAQPVVAESANAVAPTITPIGLAGEASAGQAATNTPAAPEIPPVSTAAPTTQTKQAETAGVPTSLRGEIQSNANQTEEAVTPASGREAQPAAVSGSGVAPAKTDLAQRIGAFVAKAGDVRLERLANNANPALSGAARAEIARRAGMSPKSVSGTSGNPAGTSDMENDAAALATQAARLRESASRAIGSQRAKLTALADRMDAARSAIVAQSNAPAPKKSQVGSRQSPIMRRNDLVGAIMRVTGGNGIASVMAQDIAGDKAGSALAKLRGLFTNRGVSDLGDVAMLLREEEGFDVRDGNHLAELIRKASSGDVAVSMDRAARDADADQEKRHRDRIRSQAKKYGVKAQFVKFSDLEARVLKVMEQRHDKAVSALDDRAKKRFDAALERSYSLVSEDEVDAVLVDVNGLGFRGRSFWNEATKLLRGMNDDAVARKMEEVIDAAVEGPEPDWLKDDDGRGNQPTGSGGEANRGDQAEAPGFGLTGQSAEDVARQEADRVAAEKAAKEEAEKEAAEKAAAEKKSIADKIKERAENPDNFQFGEDAKAAAKQMGGLFEQPDSRPEPEQRSTINQAFEEGQKKVVESESASQPGDFNAMFNDIMGEISPEESVPATPKPSADRAPSEEPSAPRAPRTPRASRPTRTAGEAAASAASNLAGGFGDITNALGALFGTKSGGRLSTGLSFDEDTYAKALPLFKSAVSKFNAAGKDLRELMKALMLDVQRKFGSDALRNMQPYVVRFMEDVQAGKVSLEEQNVTDKRGRVDLERDSQNPNAENGLGEKGVLDGSEPNGRSGEPGVSGAEANGGAGSGGGISGHEALATGAASDNAIYTGASELSPGSAGNSVSVGSGDLRLDGPPIEPEAAKGIDAAATSRSDLARKVALQSRAPTSPDASIADALPILSEGQQDDVAKAEKRFAAPDGYGMLFTNGTGTGKTFTGLGIVKRHVNAGKGNILIVVPNDKIIEDWQKSGQLLGLTISALANTKDAGKGVVITTYANMGQNSELAKRDWDLVVHDEAHHLMENAKTEATNSLKTLRAITLHPDGAYQRHAMLNGEGMARLAELDALAKSERMSDDERNWLLASATQAKADKLRAELRDKESAIKADVAARQGADRPRALFLSFTPFAYEPSIDWANGYLFDYNEGRPSEEGVFRGYNEGSNREQFFMQHFGYRMRTGKLNKPDAKVDAGLMQRQFNGFLKKKGSLSGRMLDVDADYDRRFVLVDSAIGARIDEAMEWFENKEDETNDKTRTAAMRDVRKIISEKFDYLSRRYLLEAIKAQEVIPHIREHLAMGRKVVVFHDYNKGGGFNPFDLSERAIDAEMSESGDAEAINGIIREFRTEFKDLISSDLFKASSPITNFQIEFPGILLVNGSVPAKVRRENVAKFQDDASGPQVILVQAQAGKEGISLHDTTGKHQRVLFNLGQPTQPTMAMQQEGRIYRMGQVSDAIIRYLNTGTNWEKWAFATTIAQRASAAENLGSGEMARAIKDAFISGFEESGDYRAGMEGEGKGGKDRDKAANDAISEYDRAKAFYFGTQKKDARSKSREGTDYYATPEPIGLKMVEFADIRPGDDVMEPSAGHGAIARWFSEQSKRTAIEPSSVLRARLAMVFDGNIIGRDFESLNVVNKFDAIVMNPPFGVGGKTAIDHLTKAATHLRNGGRIVAILPTGPAADKKLDKWLNEGEEKPIKPLVVHPTLGPIYFGDTISTRSDFNAVVERALSNDTIVAKEPSMPSGTAHLVRSIVKIDPTGNRSRTEGANKGLYLIADMQLPSVTFERASTAVRAHIVVLEKQTDQAKLNTVPQQINRDYTDAADIGELFTRMENAFVRPRENARKEEDSTQNPVSEAKGPAGKVQPVGAEATVEKVLPGGKLLTDAPVVTYTTKAGKKLEGVIAKGLQKDGAKAIDPFTWAKDGGFFIRLKHVVRPKEESGGDDAIRYNVASPGAGRGPIFSFAGQQSATADKFQLDRAQQLLADGADAEAVRQQTGWFKGADGKWRYEIDDSGASLKAHGFGFGELLDAIGKSPKLADVLDHPALFAAYPSIAGASVEAFDEKSQNNGELVANKEGGFTIRVNAGLGEAKALSVLLHEIQHGIQNVEGFASGGSPETMASFDNPQIRKLEDKISTLMANSKPGKQIAKEVAEINAKIADLRRENPYSAYRRLAGEVEARNVQARQNFSADRRKYANPDETADTARADVIVVFNGKAAASAPAPANARPSAAGVTGVSPADSAIYSMAQEGKSAAEILSFIGKASRRPFNRYLANALRNLGAASTITLDSQGGFAFGNRSYAQKYAAAYNPKTDTVALFAPREAERHVLHELVHGATLKAIANGGPASMRMRALFRHVQKSGALDGQYGMSSLDEFVAEAFSNPKFQQALKAVQAPKGSTLKSAWQWFVQAVARILGLRTPAMETALDRAMTEGAALMRENAELAGVAQGSDRYAIAWHGTPHVWAPEPGFPHGRPRLDKMGSGEGAQAYGWGWYSAESRGVADEYAGKLSKPIVSFPTGVDSAHTGGLSGAAKEVVKRMQQIAEETKYGSKAEQAGKAFFMAPESVQKELSGNAPRWNAFDILDAGNLYQLDIPDDVLPSLLDWDKPLSEQPEKVREALERAGIVNFKDNIGPSSTGEIRPLGWTRTVGSLRGEELYRRLIEREFTPDKGATTAARKSSERAASELLNAAGIPGLRYLDQGSRADGTGTYNYVIWDQPTLDRIALLERNGEKLDAIRAADEAVRFNVADDLPPTITINGVERPTTNSNGKPIHPTLEGVRNFWKWFGDSKVVDGQGRPLVVYHFTNNDIGGTFKQAQRKARIVDQRTGEWARLAGDGIYYFATEQNYPTSVGWGRTKFKHAVYLRLINKKLITREESDRLFVDDDLSESIKENGHDGTISDDGKELTVFNSIQIKSATGNSGQFDPENPDIRYNAATDWYDNNAPQSVKSVVANALRSDAKTSWLTPFNTQYHKSEKWAKEGRRRFKTVFDLVQRFLGDVSKFAVMAQNEAPTLFHEWRTLADVKRTLTSGDVLGNQHRADVAAIASPLYEGTLYGGGNPLSGIRWSDDQLRNRFNLTDRQIKLYHEALAAVKVSMDEMAKSIVAQHAKRVGVDFDEGMSLEDMVADVSNRMEELQDEIQFQFLSEEAEESVAASVENYLEMDMEEEAQKTRANFEKQKKAAQAQIEQIDKTMEDIKAVESKNVALQKAGYFPLMRFGKHTVTAKDADGKVQFFGMYEGIPLVPRSGQYEANKVAAELRAEFPEWTVTTGIKNDEKYKLYQGLNIEAIQLFADHMDKEDLEPFQEFIRLATNNRSAQRRLLHRQGTPGFDRDVRRTLAQFVVSNARSTSSNYHTQDMLRAAADAEKDGGDIGAEAVKLVEYVRNPAEEAQALRGFLFFNFLGGSLASAMVNLTQTPMMTLPFLSKFESAQRVTRRLMAAAKMAAGNPESLPAGKLRDALLRAEMDGVTAPQEIHQLTATAANNIFAGSRLANGLLRGWGAPFAMAESFNRRISFIAAFQIAESMSPAELAKTGFKDAFEFAEDAVKQTQGIYNKGNRMNVGRGSVGSVLMTFKQYSIMYLELLKRLPPKQRAIMVGVLLLAAGGGGLPGVEDVEDLIDTIGQWLGFATNSRRALRNTLTEWVGRDGSDIVLNGLLSRMGIDLHSRMGMQNLIPGTGILKQSSVDKGRDIEEFFGPAASVVKSLGDALESLATGHPRRAGMALAPGAVRNVVQGAKMAATGYAEDAKGRRTVPVNELESAAKMVGFNPKSVADYGTVKRDIAQDQRLVGVKREEFTSAIADAILSGDTEARKQAMSDMAQWNRDNPTLRFTIAPGAIVRRVKEARTEGATRFLKAVPKGMRSQAIEEMRQ